MRDAPRGRLGLPAFGPIATRGEFHPLSSTYLEPLIVLAVPGVLLWAISGISMLCFCYRRYRLGLCGEPFPTVIGYTPRQKATNRLVTAVSFTAILLIAGSTLLLINLTLDTAEDAFLDAIGRVEQLVNSSFGVGRGLLDVALDILAELDDFEAFIAQFVDAAAMLDTLQCVAPLLDSLPDGATLLTVSDGLQAAIESRPLIDITDSAFALLAYPLATMPAQIPPIIAALDNLQAQMLQLPDLTLLAARLDALNVSAVNATGDATNIVTSLTAFNASVHAMPDLPLLLDRMERVYHSQSPDHICASIPLGWRPGDLTECDLLRAQLVLASEVLEASSPATPILQLQAYEALLAEFPPLRLIVGNLTAVRRVTAEFTNLTTSVLEYEALNGTFMAWRPDTISDALRAMHASAAALADAEIGNLLPELNLLLAAYAPLNCVDTLLRTLETLNASLLLLPADSQVLHKSADDLQRALRALPDAGHFKHTSLDAIARLQELPDALAYLAAVETLDAAIRALPGGASLTYALGAVQAVVPLPTDHGELVNTTSRLLEAIEALPHTTPHAASLAAFNRTRDVLPPLIDTALATIAYYDETGDDSDMSSIHLVTAELVVLLNETRTRPGDASLRAALARVEDRLRAMPATQPHQEQLLALRGQLDTLPPLPPRTAQLNDVLAAALAAPEVGVLHEAWQAFNRSLLMLPDLPTARPHLASYYAMQASLDEPPSAALADALGLQATWASIPGLVAQGKQAVSATHAETVMQLNLLSRGLFGEDLSLYSTHMWKARPAIDLWRFVLLLVTFTLPVVVAGLAVLACCVRRGELALHAGQTALVLLPWVALLGASVELPLAVLLRDGCDQMETFTYRMLGEAGIDQPALERAKEPVYGYMTGCVESDPMVNFFAPVDGVTRAAQRDVVDAVVHLTLRDEPAAAVARLEAAVASIATDLATVRTVMSCGAVADLFAEAKSSVCCDMAYAATFLWISRLMTAAWLIPAGVGAIAGYKRFRLELWGPYATVQALEVGAYL